MNTCNECSHIHKEWCVCDSPGEIVETVMVDMICGSATKDSDGVCYSTVNAQPGENGVPKDCPRYLDQNRVFRGLRMKAGTELNGEGDELVLKVREWRPFLVVSNLSDYVLLLPGVQTRQICAPFDRRVTNVSESCQHGWFKSLGGELFGEIDGHVALHDGHFIIHAEDFLVGFAVVRIGGPASLG